MQAYSFLISTWVNVQKYLLLLKVKLYKYNIREKGLMLLMSQSHRSLG